MIIVKVNHNWQRPLITCPDGFYVLLVTLLPPAHPLSTRASSSSIDSIEVREMVLCDDKLYHKLPLIEGACHNCDHNAPALLPLHRSYQPMRTVSLSLYKSLDYIGGTYRCTGPRLVDGVVHRMYG